jgi:hypothetical protein
LVLKLWHPWSEKDRYYGHGREIVLIEAPSQQRKVSQSTQNPISFEFQTPTYFQTKAEQLQIDFEFQRREHGSAKF